MIKHQTTPFPHSMQGLTKPFVMADFALHLNKLISIMPFVAAIDLIDILVTRHAGCRIMLSFSYDV